MPYYCKATTLLAIISLQGLANLRIGWHTSPTLIGAHMRYFFFGLVVWVTLGLIGGAALNAKARHEYKNDLFQSGMESRKSQGFHIVWGAIAGPLSFIWGFALTGGFHYGLSLRGTPFPCTYTDPEERKVWCEP